MVLLNNGKNRIRDQIVTDLEEGQVGTGTTAETPDDTGLETPLASTNFSLTTTKTDKQVSLDYVLPSTSGNGNTLTEYAITVNGGATGLTHTVFEGLAKQNTEEWQIITILTIE